MRIGLSCLVALSLTGSHNGAAAQHFRLAEPYRFDSDLSVLLEGKTHGMVLRTAKKELEVVTEEIREQLFFLTGALNGHFSCADIINAKIDIKKTEPVQGTALVDVYYQSHFQVAWSKKHRLPKSLAVAVPLQADEASQEVFYKQYCKECSENPAEPKLDATTFFYYYRPNKAGCPIFSPEKKLADLTYARMTFTPSGKMTRHQYPEYHKVWADGRLVFTAIFGTFDDGATSNLDQGIHAYNLMHWYLRKYFGNPLKTNVALGAEDMPGIAAPDIEMEWNTPEGPVNVNLLLLNKDLEVDQVFLRRYNERTQISDVVAYNGHSGYGANIKYFGTLGTFSPGQWQLYYMNGCDTFAYVDDSLRAAHEKVNPGSKPYEFFNIITNSMPTPFYSFASSNMLILDAMIKKQKTYRGLLSELDPWQMTNVMGEQDNVFRPKLGPGTK